MLKWGQAQEKLDSKQKIEMNALKDDLIAKTEEKIE